MSKAKISGARAASLKVKTASIASKLPNTRNPDGSIKERDKTGGKGKAAPKAAPATAPKATDATNTAPAATPAQVPATIPAADETKAAKSDLDGANVGKAWTQQEDTELKLMVGEGYSVKVIAERLGRTENGVEARIGTLKIFTTKDTPTERAIKLLTGPKSSNGKHAETPAQVLTVGGADAPKADQAEELAPAEVVELPMRFLTAALSIAPKEDTRYYLNGVHVHQLDDNTLRICATDGHRLFLASIAHDKPIKWAQEGGVILPRGELERIAKYLGKNAPALQIEYGVKHPSLTIREIDTSETAGIAVFKFSPIDGKFPDYQRVVDDAAQVFTAAREELDASTIDAKYLKAAGALSVQLDSKGVVPYLAPQGAGYPSVFAFTGVPEALLYVMAVRAEEDRPALPAPTIKLFGEAAMRAQLAKLEEQIKHTRANAKAAKHEKFRVQFEQKADRLQLRADQIRANIAPKLPAPKSEEQPAATAPAEAVASKAAAH